MCLDQFTGRVSCSRASSVARSISWSVEAEGGLLGDQLPLGPIGEDVSVDALGEVAVIRKPQLTGVPRRGGPGGRQSSEAHTPSIDAVDIRVRVPRGSRAGRVRVVRIHRYPGDESLKRRSPDLTSMELRVIEKTDTELRIEIAGEDHTFMNVLKGVLLETDGVAAATYDMNPEQSGGQTEPVLTVKSESEDPLDLLADAAEAITQRTGALRDAVQAA